MKLLKIIKCPGVLLLLASTFSAAYGQVMPPNTEWFTQFSQCDAQFFKTLQEQALLFRQAAPLEKQGEYARFKMTGSDGSLQEQIKFTQPITLGNIQLTGYRSDNSNLGPLGVYHFWGFITRGTVGDVAEKIRPFMFDNQRLRQDGKNFVRSEIKVGAYWTPNYSTSNTPPGLSRVERVFLIELLPEDPDSVFISCSIQGGVDAKLLKEIRPDIPASEQVVVPPPPPSFTELRVPEKIIPAVTQAAESMEADWWRPSFKKLRYTLISKNPETQKSHKSEVHLEATGNQILSNTYGRSNSIPLSRSLTMLGGLVDLKQEYPLLGLQIVLTDITLRLPPKLKKDALLEIESQNQVSVFPKPPQTVTYKKSCRVEETIPATDIDPQLSGNAIKISCSPEKLIILEKLGVVINFDRDDPNQQIGKFEITQ